MNMEQTECSETSAYKIQTPGNFPEENIQQGMWIIQSNTSFLLLKYTYIQGYMFQLHAAIIRTLPRTDQYLILLYNWDPKSLQCWSIIACGVWLS
jgi:hypothetical protein